MATVSRLADSAVLSRATFLFTDVEGSTRLWEEHADAMLEVFDHHDRLLTDTIGRHGGRVLTHTGDGLVARHAITDEEPGHRQGARCTGVDRTMS
jgi:class 3 adenylate cyclase